MANYDVVIERALRFATARKLNDVVIKRALQFATARKLNDVVIKRALRFAAKRRRDDWIQNFVAKETTASVSRKIRFRFQ